MMKAMMGPRPFYRSWLFWLGVPVLVFLLWVWWDSLRNATALGSEMRLSGRGFHLQAFQPEMGVERGMVQYHRSRVTGSSPDIVVAKDPLGFHRKKGPMFMAEGQERICGFKSMERDLDVSPSRLRVKAVMCWFPIWFLVVGYGVVWLGSVVVWQRRKWRKWRKFASLKV